MGRRPCCAKEGLNRGAWTAHEDRVLTEYIKVHGDGSWRNLPKRAGLKRCGKSCRLRWLNYLRPGIKRGNISQDEEELIIRLHKLLGNRWSLIAGRIPGRTDNEIKNYWNTNLCKKVESYDKFKVPYKHLNSSAENDTKRPTKIELCPKINEGSKLGSNPVVIRTKATRCTKVLIDHQQQSHVTQISRDHSGLNSIIGQECCNISTTTTTTTTIPEDNNLYNTLFSRHDQDNDFIMDFNGEDFCLSDFINSDYLSDHNMSDTNYDHEVKNDILTLDEKGLRFSSDDQEMSLQEWNGKDYHNNNVDHESSSNFDHQIIPTFQSLATINSLMLHGDEQWLLH